jgi:hypothetical protein
VFGKIAIPVVIIYAFTHLGVTSAANVFGRRYVFLYFRSVMKLITYTKRFKKHFSTGEGA